MVIKAYNEKSSSRASLTGGKRTAVANLLEKVNQSCHDILLADLSDNGQSRTAFTDDAWNNKKIMPGYQWNHPANSRDWKNRRLITQDTFTVFLKYVINQQNEKLVTLRRKWDKSQLEEAAQLATLCVHIAEEASQNMPELGRTAVEDFVSRFESNDSEIVLELQTAVQDLNPTFKWDCIKWLADIASDATAQAWRWPPLPIQRTLWRACPYRCVV